MSASGWLDTRRWRTWSGRGRTRCRLSGAVAPGAGNHHSGGSYRCAPSYRDQYSVSATWCSGPGGDFRNRHSIERCLCSGTSTCARVGWACRSCGARQTLSRRPLRIRRNRSSRRSGLLWLGAAGLPSVANPVASDGATTVRCHITCSARTAPAGRPGVFRQNLRGSARLDYTRRHLHRQWKADQCANGRTGCLDRAGFHGLLGRPLCEWRARFVSPPAVLTFDRPTTERIQDGRNRLHYEALRDAAG